MGIWCGFDRASSIICGNKMPTRCNRWIFIADLIAWSTCFGHHYAHHQELESIIQVVAACRIWFAGCCSLQTGHTTLSSTPYRQLENQAPNTTGSNHLYNTLELLMKGTVVPETCWASNKICNKNSSVASSWHFISTYHHGKLSSCLCNSCKQATVYDNELCTTKNLKAFHSFLSRCH